MRSLASELIALYIYGIISLQFRLFTFGDERTLYQINAPRREITTFICYGAQSLRGCCVCCGINTDYAG